MKFRMIALFVSAVSSVSAFAGNYAGQSANGGFTSPDDVHAGVSPKAEKGLNKMAVPHAAIQSAPMATPQKTPQTTPTIQTPQRVPTIQRTPSYSVPAPTAQLTPSYSVPTVKAQLTPQIASTKQLTPTYSVPAVKQQLTPQAVSSKQPQITGASYRAYVTQLQASLPTESINAVSVDNTNKINVSVSSLKFSTPVNVTVDGVTTTTTAGAIAAIDPSIQVAVPHVAAFRRTTIKGGTEDKSGHASLSGHDGRGSDNAHSHAFGGHGYGHDNSNSEGFGGHSHFH
jgi:predicted component of type VI protein secretion system